MKCNGGWQLLLHYGIRIAWYLATFLVIRVTGIVLFTPVGQQGTLVLDSGYSPWYFISLFSLRLVLPEFMARERVCREFLRSDDGGADVRHRAGRKRCEAKSLQPGPESNTYLLKGLLLAKRPVLR